MTTCNDQVWFTKKCRLIGRDGAKRTAEYSAVEVYLLAGALLKPEVDRRQLTIYAPSRAKILSRTSAVLWSLVRWAEPSHKPKKAQAFKNLFSHSPSLEKQGHMLVTSREQRSCVGQLAAVAFGSFFSSSAAFLCFPSAGDAWFGSSWHSGGATGREGVGVMLLTPCESWGFGGGVNAEQPRQGRLLSSLPSVYLSIFFACLFLAGSRRSRSLPGGVPERVFAVVP